MAFKSYLVTPAADGALELTAPEPLVLSGRHGLIALHVLADPDRASRPWTLLPADLIQLTKTPPRGPSWIVLEQTEGSDLRLSRLEKLTGVSNDQTEILLTLVPLAVIRRSPVLTARELATGRAWREELALDSGAFSRDGHWRWCNRPLNIGATVVGGSGR
ncbi:MAG: hypothetical protein WC661_15185 [Opitutaceae bacterium]|jgi:hypothetical protein